MLPPEVAATDCTSMVDDQLFGAIVKLSAMPRLNAETIEFSRSDRMPALAVEAGSAPPSLNTPSAENTISAGDWSACGNHAGAACTPDIVVLFVKNGSKM